MVWELLETNIEVKLEETLGDEELLVGFSVEAAILFLSKGSIIFTCLISGIREMILLLLIPLSFDREEEDEAEEDEKEMLIFPLLIFSWVLLLLLYWFKNVTVPSSFNSTIIVSFSKRESKREFSDREV
jgi:hypothetical protein